MCNILDRHGKYGVDRRLRVIALISRDRAHPKFVSIVVRPRRINNNNIIITW